MVVSSRSTVGVEGEAPDARARESSPLLSVLMAAINSATVSTAGSVASYVRKLMPPPESHCTSIVSPVFVIEPKSVPGSALALIVAVRTTSGGWKSMDALRPYPPVGSAETHRQIHETARDVGDLKLAEERRHAARG